MAEIAYAPATSVRSQLPLAPARVTEHVFVPSEMVTEPVGVPSPGDTGATDTVTAKGWPVTAGEIAVMLVEVSDLPIEKPCDVVDVRKFESPS